MPIKLQGKATYKHLQVASSRLLKKGKTDLFTLTTTLDNISN